MNKPVHKTFTKKDYSNTFHAAYRQVHTAETADMRQVLDCAAKDLLQPRQEAITSILRLSRLSNDTFQ